jgi:hypothetical protein
VRPSSGGASTGARGGPMNPAERNPWRRELARRIREFDVGPTGLAVHAIRPTAAAPPPMRSGTSAQTIRADAWGACDRLTQIGALR